ncbi:MAG: 3-deoxy-D-manno-octulosonic acid transferase [Planctomycetota bacterium]|nr:3-deoxy-D-manno-octulosonic acid transferase [Planctomycetota bacterium]
MKATTRNVPLSRRATLLVGALLLDFLYLLVSPLVLVVLLIVSRGFTRPKVRRGFLRRLGFSPCRRGERPVVWIHAVSVGEVLVAEPLVRAFQKEHGDWDVVLSTSTYTGEDVARRRLPDLPVFYFPLDVTPCTSLALRRTRPVAVVLLELEVWPGFLLAARRRGVPVLVANGRLTERSARRYRWLGPFGRFLFRQVAAYSVQSDEYARRFRGLGARPESVEVLGNMKYDRSPPASAARPDETRALLGWSRQSGAVILVAGCTHPGEERMLSAMLSRLAERQPGLRLVLAPRHVERLVSGEVESWRCPSPVVCWSELRDRDDGPHDLGENILLVDTVGDLERFYAAADLVVVGGSFVPHGGHNLLEPTRLSRPTLFGPHHENFKEEARHLLEHGGAICVADAVELEKRLGDLLDDPEERRQLGERARRATDLLKGAVERHLEWLDRQFRLFLDTESW